jgi:hypothetical protein
MSRNAGPILLVIQVTHTTCWTLDDQPSQTTDMLALCLAI